MRGYSIADKGLLANPQPPEPLYLWECVHCARGILEREGVYFDENYPLHAHCVAEYLSETMSPEELASCCGLSRGFE